MYEHVPVSVARTPVYLKSKPFPSRPHIVQMLSRGERGDDEKEDSSMVNLRSDAIISGREKLMSLLQNGSPTQSRDIQLFSYLLVPLLPLLPAL